MQLQSARSLNPQSQPRCSLVPDNQSRRQQINYDKIRGICSNSLFPKSEEQTLLRLLTLLIRRKRETKAKVNLCEDKTLLWQPVLRTICGIEKEAEHGKE